MNKPECFTSIAEWTLFIKVLSNRSLPIVLYLFPSFLGLINYSISPNVGRCRLGVGLKDEDNSNEVEDKVEIKDIELRKKQNSTHVLSHMPLISVVHSQSRKSSALPMGYQRWDLNIWVFQWIMTYPQTKCDRANTHCFGLLVHKAKQ